MQITASITQEISVSWREIMTTKPEYGQWTLAWCVESLLAWEGYGCEALRGHIVINSIFSGEKLPWLVKNLITIAKLIILISRMVYWLDPFIKLILLSKLDHSGAMYRQASWHTDIDGHVMRWCSVFNGWVYPLNTCANVLKLWMKYTHMLS